MLLLAQLLSSHVHSASLGMAIQASRNWLTHLLPEFSSAFQRPVLWGQHIEIMPQPLTYAHLHASAPDLLASSVPISFLMGPHPI